MTHDRAMTASSRVSPASAPPRNGAERTGDPQPWMDSLELAFLAVAVVVLMAWMALLIWLALSL